MNNLIIFLTLLDIITGIIVFKVKHKSLNREIKYTEIFSLVQSIEHDIITNEAEWSYLTSPQYLKSVLKKHPLKLAPLQSSQAIKPQNLPNVKKEKNAIPADLFKARTGKLQLIDKSEKRGGGK